MKTIICGPPHSGKSVLIANLLRYLPSDSYLRINANGDGEGTWSNNPDQTEIQRVRIKTGNTAEKFSIWTNNIRLATQDVVIIDIGGKLQSDKDCLFDAADSFVVLSSDPHMVQPWKDYGESHGCKCLAVIESYLEPDYDEVIDRKTDFIHARISGLERGRFLSDSVVVKALANVIVTASGYRRTRFLDFCEVGEAVRCASTWKTESGVPVTHLHFEREHGPLVYEYLSGVFVPHTRYKVFGLKTNWIAAITAHCLAKENPISFFDDRSGSFKTSDLLKKNRDAEKEGWVIEEDDHFVRLSRSVPGEKGTIDSLEGFTIPVINEEKVLLLSGRFPMWVVASILLSYSSPEQYLFQPGNHFFCVKSDDSRKLGTDIGGMC